MIATKAKMVQFGMMFRELHSEFQGWTFELESPGYPVYTLAGKWKIYFVPNEHRQGYVTLRVYDVERECWANEAHVPSHVPVSAEELFQIVRPWLQKYGKENA